MGRRRKQEPKRNQLCLRLTDRQLELLKAYSDFRNFDSEVDAVRGMIDGLDDWLVRQRARNASPGDSGPRRDTDVERGDARPSDVADRSINDVTDRSINDDRVGDFGGRPNPGLPGSLEPLEEHDE